MINDIKQDAQARMTKSIDALRHTLTTIRTGRASPALLDGIKVKAYGTDTPLNQVASISVSEGRSLVITLFDKNMIKEVEKAIYASDIGITPTTMGTVIRLNLPPLTEERRKELAKSVGKEGEETKISIRNIRRHAKDSIDRAIKDGDVGEDDGLRTEKDLEALTKRHVDLVDTLLKGKEAELLEI